MKNVKFLISVLAILIMSSVQAEEFYSFMYKIEEGDTFSSILKKFVNENAIINIKSSLVAKTMKRNPQISSWNELPKDTSIELFISKDVMDLNKYKNYEKEILKKLDEDDEKKKTAAMPEGLKGSVFYMASLGIFTQKKDNIAEINFRQNSPISLGSAFTFYPKGKLYSVSFSAYYSMLLASVSSLSNDEVAIPPEIGGNIYGEYLIKEKNFTFYSGIDYETFSTFNLRGLQNDKKIYVDRVGAMYLTMGIAKLFTIFDRKVFSKFSLSKSMATTYKDNAPLSDINASGHVDSGKYDGYKFMVYLNYKFNEKFFTHTLFKYHTMTGPSDLTTLRIGVGVGYILF